MQRTADPAATLGMTKGRMALRFSVAVDAENCRSLGYARDDKGEDGASVQWLLMERTADPSASLGMTKGRMALRFSVAVDAENCRSLGYARDDKGEDGASVQCGC